MKKLCTFIAISLLTLHLFAQGTILGRIIDQSGQPLEYVTVTLHRAKDSVLVKGALSDASGKYDFAALKNGAYIVMASQVGLKKIYSTPSVF